MRKPRFILNSSYVPSGAGSPQGIIEGVPGLQYWDTVAGAFWVCTGGTNWQKLIQL